MQDARETGASTGPSRKSLLRSAIVALAAAVLVTVLFVLPAEYGVDPTGLGARLGLTRLAGVTAPAVDSTPRIVTGAFPDIPTEFDFYDPEVLGDPFSRTHDAAFRSDTLTIDLDVGEEVEYKAVMHQGDALVYSWRLTSGSVVYTDFHADPGENDAYPEDYWIRYRESETGSAAGSIVAPFDGNHGWYWLNIEEQPVTIELEVRGFYDGVSELMRNSTY